MTGNTERPFNQIVRTEIGNGTGEEYYQTGDGKWWEKWNGEVQTGQEIRTLFRGDGK